MSVGLTTMVVFPHRHISPRGYMGLWGRLDASPGVSFLHGLTAGGDPELAVDGFDLGSYGVRGDVEALCHLPGGELAYEQAKHIVLALRKLRAWLGLPRLSRAKLPFMALEKFGECAGVRESLQNGPRLGERLPTPGPVATRGSYRRERQQADEGRPGAQAGQSLSGRECTLQLLLGFLQFPAFCERTAERDVDHRGLRNLL